MPLQLGRGSALRGPVGLPQQFFHRGTKNPRQRVHEIDRHPALAAFIERDELLRDVKLLGELRLRVPLGLAQAEIGGQILNSVFLIVVA